MPEISTKNPMTTRFVGFRYEEKELAQLDRRAEQEERTRSQMIRWLIKQGLAA